MQAQRSLELNGTMLPHCNLRNASFNQVMLTPVQDFGLIWFKWWVTIKLILCHSGWPTVPAVNLVEHYSWCFCEGVFGPLHLFNFYWSIIDVQCCVGVFCRLIWNYKIHIGNSICLCKMVGGLYSNIWTYACLNSTSEILIFLILIKLFFF